MERLLFLYNLQKLDLFNPPSHADIMQGCTYGHTSMCSSALAHICTCDTFEATFALVQSHTVEREHAHTQCIPALWIRGTD